MLVPPDAFWDELLVASELVEYETWVRLHRAQRAASHGDAARAEIGRMRLVALGPKVLARAKEPFPIPGPHAGRPAPGDGGVSVVDGASTQLGIAGSCG